MFEYEHERVCFARIDECDGGMYATIILIIFGLSIYTLIGT